MHIYIYILYFPIGDVPCAGVTGLEAKPKWVAQGG